MNNKHALIDIRSYHVLCAMAATAPGDRKADERKNARVLGASYGISNEATDDIILKLEAIFK